MRYISHIVLFLAWLGALYIATEHAPPEGRRIDCSLVEISPDFTPEMRKACRERRSIKV
jgi:hypothetical protein